MFDLFLMRHGKAEAATRGMQDHERPLARRGRENVQSQARVLLPGADHAMLISAAVRTQETAKILLETWKPLVSAIPTDITITRQGYLAPAEVWMDLCAMTPDACSAMWIVGHNPGVSELVTLLTGEYIGMATADVVHIGLDITGWTSIAPGCGQVVAFRPGRAV